MNLVDRSYQNELQDNGALPASIKEFVVEHVRDQWYRGYMILEDGTKIWCNTGVIGDNISYKGKKCTPAEWFKAKIEETWYNRKTSFGVLVK